MPARSDFEKLWTDAQIAVYIQRRWLSKLDDAVTALHEAARLTDGGNSRHIRSLADEIAEYVARVDDSASEIEAILGG